MDIITTKLEELKNLLIDKPISEQKEIIVNFFYENRKISKHFKNFYKYNKEIFEKSSLSDFILQEFINKTFIDREIILPYSTYIEVHRGGDWDTDGSEFEDLDDLTEQQKDALIKNRGFKLRR